MKVGGGGGAGVWEESGPGASARRGRGTGARKEGDSGGGRRAEEGRRRRRSVPQREEEASPACGGRKAAGLMVELEMLDLTGERRQLLGGDKEWQRCSCCFRRIRRWMGVRAAGTSSPSGRSPPPPCPLSARVQPGLATVTSSSPCEWRREKREQMSRGERREN
uniref:Uncharacterized protein n=1 Tax=Oryza punctata TaxID=4537 RepID=A0A0E0LB56_ORYPU